MPPVKVILFSFCLFIFNLFEVPVIKQDMLEKKKVDP